MDEEQQICTKGLRWDKPRFLLDDKPFYPIIFDPSDRSIDIPDGFNTIIIKINGMMKADLDWKNAKKYAQSYIEKGYFILWEIELGLFSNLAFALDHQTQYLSLTLSLEHFRDSLWKEFNQHSLGLILYRGSADFSCHFEWTHSQVENLRGWLLESFAEVETFTREIGISISDFNDIEPDLLQQNELGKHLLKIFCRDVSVEYLAFLSNNMPDELPRHLLLDIPSNTTAYTQTVLLNPERFEQFNVIVKNSFFCLQTMGWDKRSPFGYVSNLIQPSVQNNEVKIGVCLASIDLIRPSQSQGIETALKYLLENKKHFRVISESHLITEWDGLDYLLYVPKGLSSQGKRKLQGFCAAGGTAVSLGEKIGLAQEISWSSFCS
ncbi:MAG: hypothetical protein H0W88_11785 [Parachlamydiaceae bacterium]|nr:hypothetical protein [Parachlamydiaceae bacterium]